MSRFFRKLLHIPLSRPFSSSALPRLQFRIARLGRPMLCNVEVPPPYDMRLKDALRESDALTRTAQVREILRSAHLLSNELIPIDPAEIATVEAEGDLDFRLGTTEHVAVLGEGWLRRMIDEAVGKAMEKVTAENNAVAEELTKKIESVELAGQTKIQSVKLAGRKLTEGLEEDVESIKHVLMASQKRLMSANAVNRLVLSKALAKGIITVSQHKHLVRYASAGAVLSRPLTKSVRQTLGAQTTSHLRTFLNGDEISLLVRTASRLARTKALTKLRNRIAHPRPPQSKKRDLIKSELIKQGARPEWAEEQAKAAMALIFRAFASVPA
ncbi:hypothetical protein NBRC10512_004520 [Rhodotorula toruloides]|uniref:RHTO0S14e03796g1_1 n=2 Tax=Rhodotorula toruloides TaxID=5286 RepID=A0A061BBX8_RHOTO|nr:uncharacterized protein RHTO_05053 [Rhodotorula toruloides NP11]EMS24873.1 hypothetical protein RHTO_05053 [Rhodotorula toruloides NP11]CDR47447.1 RHTO0S14e03796g1_1 [Rhodotorula toruloides]